MTLVVKRFMVCHKVTCFALIIEVVKGGCFHLHNHVIGNGDRGARPVISASTTLILRAGSCSRHDHHRPEHSSIQHDMEREPESERLTQPSFSDTLSASPVEEGAGRSQRSRASTDRFVDVVPGNHGDPEVGLGDEEKRQASFLVEFDGPDDPLNPQNWPFRQKVYTTALFSATTFGATFGSSVYSSGTRAVSEQFGVSTEIATLGLSLFVLGFAVGPIFFSPIGELYGRKISVLLPYFVYGLFSIATATAYNFQTILIMRFLGGVCASSPVSNVGGIMGDLWSPKSRGFAVLFYASMVVGGPTLGPIVGAAIVSSKLGWRWTEYITAIWVFCILTLDLLFIQETYVPKILSQKAARLRKSTRNWALHSKFEENSPTFSEIMEKHMGRPVKMLFTEPILMCICFYASFVFGILYLSIAAFPIIFQQERGWSPLIGSLPFLAMFFGIICSGGINALNQKFYIRKFHANNNRPIPEARLPPMMIGGFFFPVGLFILGWTADPSLHWIAPCIGAYTIGLGFLAIFQSSILYIIDVYTVYSASAIGANTILRSLTGAGFPMAAQSMFRNLGTAWACSTLGFIAVAAIPIPYLFYRYGKQLRSHSGHVNA